MLISLPLRKTITLLFYDRKEGFKNANISPARTAGLRVLPAPRCPMSVFNGGVCELAPRFWIAHFR